MSGFFFARHKSAPSIFAGVPEKREEMRPSEPSSCELLLKRLKQQKKEIPANFLLKRKSAPTVAMRGQSSRTALPAKVSKYLAKPSVGRPSAKKQKLPVETMKEAHRIQEPLNKKMLLNTLDNFLCSPTPPSQKSSAESPKKVSASSPPPPPTHSSSFSSLTIMKRQPGTQTKQNHVKITKEREELDKIKNFSLEQDLDMFCVIDTNESLDEINKKCSMFSNACDAACYGVVISVVFDGKASSFRTKGLDADSTKLHVVGMAVLPDNSEKPFFLKGFGANCTNSSPIIDVLGALFSSLKRKVCYNSKLLYLPLSNDYPKLCESLEFSSVFDIKLASWLLNPDIENENLAFENIVRPVPGIHSESSSFYSVLACDMKKCLAVSSIILDKVKAASLSGPLSFETNLIPVLSDMERRGIGFSSKEFKASKGKLEKRLESLTRKACNILGHSINLSSPKQVSAEIYDNLKLVAAVGSQKKTTSEKVLLELAEKHVFPKVVIEHRHCQKLLSTYIEPLDEKKYRVPTPLYPGSTQTIYTIHSHWEQTNTGTGRLSSVNPNLQNLPKNPITFSPIDIDEKDDIVVNVRDSFESRPGYVFVISDYSQIELRILAHYTNDQKLISSFSEGIDFHTIVASRIYSKRTEDIHPEERSKAKKIIFGLLYGMGLTSLSENLGVSAQEAKSLRNSVLSNFPKMKDFITATLTNARKDGLVKTLLGRQRLVSDINSAIPEKKARAERQAVNTVIQGSAADVMKSAMVKLASKLSSIGGFILVQIHDEVVVEVPEGAQDAAVGIIRDSMVHPLPDGVLSVQLDVSISVGKSWGSAKPLSEHTPENDSFDLGTFDI